MSQDCIGTTSSRMRSHASGQEPWRIRATVKQIYGIAEKMVVGLKRGHLAWHWVGTSTWREEG